MKAKTLFLLAVYNGALSRFFGDCLTPNNYFSSLSRRQRSQHNTQNRPLSWFPILPSLPSRTTSLYAKAEDKKSKGIYVRPSGAIERGSGFFVPGLEGPRVRVLFGGILLVLTFINHITVQATSWSLEEFIAISYSLLVLFQALIEFGKEELIVEGNSSVSNSAPKTGTGNEKSVFQTDMVQRWSNIENFTSHERDEIQWIAASFLSITPATQMMLLANDSIAFRLGTDSNTPTDARIEKGVQAALDELKQSKGGRIALPASHPAVAALELKDARTIVLQRITSESCWVMSSSDQLLASFTPSDLRWLGRLAQYTPI